MKVDYISDLHLDFWIKELNPTNQKHHARVETFVKELYNPFHEVGDVLIIAGDLGHYFPMDSEFLLEIKKLYKHIILVTGNHDLYLISSKQQNKYMFNSNNRILEMKKFCRENEGFHYLDGHIINIDGHNFAGTGMSWDTSYLNFLEKNNEVKSTKDSVLQMFNNTMNDSRLIFGGYDNGYVSIGYRREYRQSWCPFKYFDEQYAKLQNFGEYDMIDVMVTHYSPVVPPNIDPRWEKEQTSTFYYFDGIEDIKRINPKYWIFGHTHTEYEFEVLNTKFLCNPLGYPGEFNNIAIKSFIL
jgi:Icc-related predicted phosphoesterase